MRNSVSHSNKWIRIASRYWIDSNLSYAKAPNQETTIKGEARWSCIYRSWDNTQNWRYPDWWINSVQLPPRNVWTLLLHIVTVLTGCLSTQASAKSHHMTCTQTLHRKLSYGLVRLYHFHCHGDYFSRNQASLRNMVVLADRPSSVAQH